MDGSFFGTVKRFSRGFRKVFARLSLPKYLRERFEADALAFRLGVMLKQARKDLGITQEELANRTGTKKSYISRIERGLSDIQVSTYHKLIAIGLGKHLNISIEPFK